jgi:hypothetical protein
MSRSFFSRGNSCWNVRLAIISVCESDFVNYGAVLSIQNKATKLNCRRKREYERLSGKAPETAAVLKAVSTTSYAVCQ